MADVAAEHIVRKLLTDSTDVTAIVGTRITPQQGTPLKDSWQDTTHITFGRAFGNHFAHMQGASGLQEVGVQLDLYSKDFNESLDLANKTRLALHGYSGNVTVGTSTVTVQEIAFDDERGLFTQPSGGAATGYHRVTQRFVVWQSETVPSF